MRETPFAKPFAAQFPRLVYSIPDAARLLSLSPHTLRKWIATGRLRATRLGSRVLVEHRELLRIIEAGRQPVQGVSSERT